MVEMAVVEPLEGGSDLRARLTAVERELIDHNQRINKAEEHRYKTDIEDAKKEVQWKGIESRLDKIDGNVAKANWIVIGALIVAIVTFALKGGFNLPNI